MPEYWTRECQNIEKENARILNKRMPEYWPGKCFDIGHEDITKVTHCKAGEAATCERARKQLSCIV